MITRGLAEGIHQACLAEDSVDARGANRNNVLIEHHERQPPVSLQWMGMMEIDNRLFFPVLEPEIPGDLGVVFVGPSVSLFPIEVLATSDPEPLNDVLRRGLGTLGPVSDVIDDLVSSIVGNPASSQGSPMAFFS